MNYLQERAPVLSLSKWPENFVRGYGPLLEGVLRVMRYKIGVEQ